MASIKVCCGPRCGAEPGHRAIYDAVEAGAAEGGTAAVLPTLCRGLCTGGVTVVRSDGEKCKARSADEARAIAAADRDTTAAEVAARDGAAEQTITRGS